MGCVGRKPIDSDLLRGYATQWACLLYGVRDGYPGFIMPSRQASAGKGASAVQRGTNKPNRTIRLTARRIPFPPTAVVTFPREDKKRVTQFLKSRLNRPQSTFRYAYLPSVQPDDEIWNRLKKAKKTEHVEQVFEKLCRWALGLHAPVIFRGTDKTTLACDVPKSKAYARAAAKKNLQEGIVSGWPLLPFLISKDWAGKILAAKRLWTYPRTVRSKSDDKRIEFFARSLAAITFGKSPATATARWLANWHWPKDWYGTSV